MNYVLGQDHQNGDHPIPGPLVPEPGFTIAEADVTYVTPGGVVAPGSTGIPSEVITITETGVQVTDVKLNEPPSLLMPILWIAGGLLAVEFLT